jgi:hypothetical protein
MEGNRNEPQTPYSSNTNLDGGFTRMLPSLSEHVKMRRLQKLKEGTDKNAKTSVISKFYVDKIDPNVVIQKQLELQPHFKSTQKLNKSLSSKLTKTKVNNSTTEISKPKIARHKEWASLNNLHISDDEETPKEEVKPPVNNQERYTVRLDSPTIPLEPITNPLLSKTPTLTDTEIQQLIESYSSKKEAASKSSSRSSSVMSFRRKSKKDSKPSQKTALPSLTPQKPSSASSIRSIREVKPEPKEKELKIEVPEKEEEPELLQVNAGNEDIPADENLLENSLEEQQLPPPEPEPVILKYPATASQQYLYLLIKDDNEQESVNMESSYSLYKDEIDSSKFYIHQGFMINRAFIKRHLIEKIICVLAVDFPILRTRFYRNELIIDADLETQIVRKEAYEDLLRSRLWNESVPLQENLSLPSYTIELSKSDMATTDSMPDLSFKTAEQYFIATKEVLKGLDPSADLLKIISFQSDDGKTSCFSVCASKLISDERTCSWLGKVIFKLYELLEKIPGATYEECYSLIKSQIHEEDTGDFIDYTRLENKNSKPSNLIPFWKSLLVEGLRDSVVDQSVIENSVEKLKKTSASLKLMRDSSKKRKAELEIVLKECVEQRKKLDQLGIKEDAEGEYDDNLRTELLKVLLKEEFGSDDLAMALESQGVSAETIQVLKLSEMTLIEFSTMTEEALAERIDSVTRKILTKERKKISLLSSFLRNKFRICLEEQSRIKFNLERKIAKTRRDLQKYTDSYKKYRHEYEICEDTIIKYHRLLNPPLTDFQVPECRFDFVNTSLLNSNNSLVNLQSAFSLSDFQTTIRRKYDWYMFDINNNITTELKRFIKDWQVIQSFKNQESSNGSQLQLTIHDHVNLLEALLVTCFSVLLKHVTGLEKFIFGMDSSARSIASLDGILVGPLSNLHPVKVDCSEGGIALNDLFDNLVNELKNMIPFKSNHISQLKDELKIEPRDLELPLRFQFISSSEYKSWSKFLKDTDNDIFGLEDSTRLWSSDESIKKNFNNDFDLKFMVIDKDSHLTGCIRYRKDLCSKKDIERWVEKFLAVLESIESGSKKVKVSAIVSRFYHSVFTSNHDLSARSSGDLQ